MAKKDTFIIHCYYENKEYKESQRQEMMDFYLEGVMCCDGAERDRYINVYTDLKLGKKYCTDGDEKLF